MSTSTAAVPATDARPGVRKGIWWLGVAVALVVAGVLSAAAYADALPVFISTVPHVDKILHVGVGGLLAFFLDGALERRAVRLAKVRVPLSALLVLVPAGVEEYLQRYSSMRLSTYEDFLADVAGVAVFTWLSRRVAP